MHSVVIRSFLNLTLYIIVRKLEMEGTVSAIFVIKTPGYD